MKKLDGSVWTESNHYQLASVHRWSVAVKVGGQIFLSNKSLMAGNNSGKWNLNPAFLIFSEDTLALSKIISAISPMAVRRAKAGAGMTRAGLPSAFLHARMISLLEAGLGATPL